MSGKVTVLHRAPVRCDICAITPGETARRILRFSLVFQIKRPDGRSTTRSVGSILLCERCWQTGPGRRRRPSAGRRRTECMEDGLIPVVAG